jgi:hypothetical protein
MISDFLVDDQRVSCRWSMTSLSMIDFLVDDQWLVVDDQWLPCRWWSMTSLSMINEFLVDDQWLPCRWSMTSLSLMINDFLFVDDQWLPCRWSVTSLLMISGFLVDDQSFPCRWWCHVFFQSLITSRNVCSLYSRNTPADGNSFVVISDCPNTSPCLCASW